MKAGRVQGKTINRRSEKTAPSSPVTISRGDQGKRRPYPKNLDQWSVTPYLLKSGENAHDRRTRRKATRARKKEKIRAPAARGPLKKGIKWKQKGPSERRVERHSSGART